VSRELHELSWKEFYDRVFFEHLEPHRVEISEPWLRALSPPHAREASDRESPAPPELPGRRDRERRVHELLERVSAHGSLIPSGPARRAVRDGVFMWTDRLDGLNDLNDKVAFASTCGTLGVALLSVVFPSASPAAVGAGAVRVGCWLEKQSRKRIERDLSRIVRLL